MDAGSQNNSFLLASLISGQGVGMSASVASQAIDNSTKPVNSSFLSSLNRSTQKLQPELVNPVNPLDMDGLLRAVNELLMGHAATTGSGLPLLEGQDLAAEMSNEDVLSLISQLQGPEAEALVGKLADLLQGLGRPAGGAAVLPGLQGLAGTTGNESVLSSISQQQGQAGTVGSELSAQQRRQQVDALFSKIRQFIDNAASSDSLSQLSKTTVANIEAASQLAEQSQSGDRRLLEKLNAVLAQQSLTTEVAKAGVNLRQISTESGLTPMGDKSDSFSNPDTARDLFGKAVVTPMPVLLERMAAVSSERQLNSGILDPMNTPVSFVQPGKADGLLANSEPRVVTSFIQSPLTAPQWQSEFSDKVMMMSRVAGQGQNQVAEIRLNPAHLGPIEVRVAMKDDQASIIFSAQHGVVRDAIEASLPRLREMFSNSGLMLADANVSEQSLQQRHKQDRNESGGQYANTDAGQSMNEQTELISQIDLSMISSSVALDLYA